MSREEAREAVVKRLGEEGLLGEIRDYTFRVGHCDRCGTVIEPWLSEQWWVSMKKLAEPAIEALQTRRITVYPDSWRRERSEEHTSELQSRQYLVCRLLLEKKKSQQL